MLEWTHNQETCPIHQGTQTTSDWCLDCGSGRASHADDDHAFREQTGCPGDTSCEAFPTNTDRKDMARAAFEAYAEADGTAFVDFLRDVVILALDDLTLGDIHEEVTKAYLLARNIEVPAELPL